MEREKRPTCTVQHRVSSILSAPCSLLCFILLLSLILSGCVSTGNSAEELQGTLNISGSTALYPLLNAAQKLYTRAHPKVTIKLTGNGSIKGLTDLVANRSHIGASDIYADFAQYPDPNITDHLICVIPFTMIVNPGVKLPGNALTTDQIYKIFSTRQLTNWHDVDASAPDLPIVPIVRTPTSGTRDTFRKYVLNGGDEDKTLTVIDSSQKVLEQVASTPGAIGYLALSVANPGAQKGSIQELAIKNGTAIAHATKDDIISGRYTFWSYEHLYTLGDDNPLVASFLDFMMQPQVQELARQQDYIPIAEMKLKAEAPVNSDNPGQQFAFQQREV